MGTSGRESRRRDRRSFRRVLMVGLVASVAVHLVLVGLYGWFFHELEPQEDAGPSPRRTWSPQMEMVPLESRARAAVEVPAPSLPTSPTAPSAVDATAVEGVPAPSVEERVVTNAERLQFKQGDRRLWLPPVAGPLTQIERKGAARAEEALRDLLQVYLDSLALSEEQRRRAREWVVEGEDGKKWGISSDGLHLGDTTIPIPFGQLFSQGGPKAREARQALRDFQMIRQQSMKQEAQAVREERREAMRERTREALERIRESDEDSTSRDTSIAGR